MLPINNNINLHGVLKTNPIKYNYKYSEFILTYSYPNSPQSRFEIKCIIKNSNIKLNENNELELKKDIGIVFEGMLTEGHRMIQGHKLQTVDVYINSYEIVDYLNK